MFDANYFKISKQWASWLGHSLTDPGPPESETQVIWPFDVRVFLQYYWFSKDLIQVKGQNSDDEFNGNLDNSLLCPNMSPDIQGLFMMKKSGNQMFKCPSTILSKVYSCPAG